MRIVSIAARTIRWSIAGRGAARGRTERAAVVLEARTDRGVVGLGEAAPLPGMSPETLGDAERAIAAFARRAPFALDHRNAAHALAASAGAPSPAARSSPSARFAIETALLDALARERQISLAALLRTHADPILPAATAAHVGAIPSPIATVPHVGARPPSPRGEQVPLAAVVDDPDGARRALAAGIACLKLKVGPDGDVARVFAIAEAAPGALLRIDANRAWPRAEVAARLAALAHLPIDYVEEPCRDAHLVLAEPLPCKLALDEGLSALTPDELGAALCSPQLAAVVLKPTLLGGLTAALALADLARRGGVAAIVSHGLEGPVGTAACAELALAVGGLHPAGLAAHPALAGWLVEVPQLAADHVHAAAAPGLGFVDLDLAGVVNACGARINHDR